MKKFFVKVLKYRKLECVKVALEKRTEKRSSSQFKARNPFSRSFEQQFEEHRSTFLARASARMRKQ